VGPHRVRSDWVPPGEQRGRVSRRCSVSSSCPSLRAIAHATHGNHAPTSPSRLPSSSLADGVRGSERAGLCSRAVRGRLCDSRGLPISAIAAARGRSTCAGRDFAFFGGFGSVDGQGAERPMSSNSYRLDVHRPTGICQAGSVFAVSVARRSATLVGPAGPQGLTAAMVSPLTHSYLSSEASRSVEGRGGEATTDSSSTSTHRPMTNLRPIGCVPLPVPQGLPARTQSAHNRKD
jgi:hypothetical protein